MVSLKHLDRGVTFYVFSDSLFLSFFAVLRFRAVSILILRRKSAMIEWCVRLRPNNHLDKCFDSVQGTESVVRVVKEWSKPGSEKGGMIEYDTYTVAFRLKNVLSTGLLAPSSPILYSTAHTMSHRLPASYAHTWCSA